MFKLILIFILFIVFIINYFFWYIYTMPYFKFITKFNFYEYLLDKIENRNWYFTWIEYLNVKIEGEDYLVDYSWWVLLTDLKYLSPHSDKLSLYIPIFILHTGDNLFISWDNIFTWLKILKDFNWYVQYISWGYSYIPVWEEIIDKKVYKQNIFLGSLYLYCSMTWTKWADAYLYDRYITFNKSWNYKKEDRVVDSYVCENDRSNLSYTEISWDWTSKVYHYCTCSNKWEYWICKTKTGALDNPEWKSCNYDNKCIDYYTGTVDLNETNCSYSWALGIWQKAKYFIIR
jgi:hypothetical protein